MVCDWLDDCMRHVNMPLIGDVTSRHRVDSETRRSAGRSVGLSFGGSVGRNSRSRQSFERMPQLCGLRTMRFIQSYLVGQYTS